MRHGVAVDRERCGRREDCEDTASSGDCRDGSTRGDGHDGENSGENGDDEHAQRSQGNHDGSRSRSANAQMPPETIIAANPTRAVIIFHTIAEDRARQASTTPIPTRPATGGAIASE